MERQTIGVAGLGLMGASLCKALGEAGHRVLGMDRDRSVLQYAKLDRTIEEELTEDNLDQCGFLFLAVYPGAAADILRQWAPRIRKETLVCDLCGVKRAVCEPCMALAEEYGFCFVGGHPMAGKQYSGIKYAAGDLYRGTVMLLVPPERENVFQLGRLTELLRDAGFGHFCLTSAENHDRMIAFTSQLAHVVSNAYVKSPSARELKNFAAGSYRDLTRVAQLNEQMWTELFLDNRDYLGEELDTLIRELCRYREALKAGDGATLKALLKEGRERKEALDAEGTSRSKP